MCDQPKTRVKQSGGMWFAQVFAPENQIFAGPPGAGDWLCIIPTTLAVESPTACNLPRLSFATETGATRAVGKYLARRESRESWPEVVKELLK